MKKMLLIVILVLMLAGCAREKTWETVADEAVQPVMAEPREIYVALPEESVLPAMESDSGKLYICKDFDVMVETLESGDLNRTIEAVCGQSRDSLTVMETENTDHTRYDFVWTSSGDEGELVGRCAILDDGDYHYVLSASVEASAFSEFEEILSGMFESFCLA